MCDGGMENSGTGMLCRKRLTEIPEDLLSAMEIKGLIVEELGVVRIR